MYTSIDRLVINVGPLPKDTRHTTWHIAYDTHRHTPPHHASHNAYDTPTSIKSESLHFEIPQLGHVYLETGLHLMNHRGEERSTTGIYKSTGLFQPHYMQHNVVHITCTIPIHIHHAFQDTHVLQCVAVRCSV
mmetsp:Transcript_45155/g.66216  ORF Transcript_45155/g.66216 Transcript_45155/m.66216 type:complete len:133 (-) Transcript_45155:2-400(-)